MTTEHELSRRLAAMGEAIDAQPDLESVVERSGHRRTRMRGAAALSTAVVAIAGVGALAVVANREPRAPSDRPPPAATIPPSGDVAAVEVVDSEVADSTIAAAPSTALDVPATTAIQPSDSTSESTGPPDLADPYLDQTTVVFDQVMNDDLRFVVRLSDASYGELFDIDWTAPTGSIDECLNGPAMMTGDPNGVRQGFNEASSWDANALPPLTDARLTDVTMAAGPFDFRISDESNTSVFVVRTQLPVSGLVVEGDGITSAVAEFVGGVATVEVTAEVIPVEPGSSSSTVALNQAIVTLQPEPGAEIDPALLTLPLFGEDGRYVLPPDCLPPPSLPVELPPPGEQPSDPVEAVATIGERFALAVDPTIPFGDKPVDLFDSAVGVEQAIADALAGTNADYVLDASYEIVDLVFTSPSEAWFKYDLDAQGVSFRPFGRATLDGETWQISRDTICQDLTRVGALCDPGAPTETVTPPDDDVSPPPTTLNEQQRMAYSDALFCNPIRPCEGR